MLEITLLKALYNEMNPGTIEGVKKFDNEESSVYHQIALEVPEFPEIKTITAEVRYLSHNGTMYYLHYNDDLTTEEDIKTPKAKAAILTFFQKYKPEYLLPELPEDGTILDCFDIDKIPDYRPKYAFPGLVMYEDIKNGKVSMENGNMPSFPGIRMLSNDQKEDGRPVTVSSKDNVTQFNGSNDDFQKKMEELKKQFNISDILGNN